VRLPIGRHRHRIGKLLGLPVMIASLLVASPAGAALSNTSDPTWMTNGQVAALVRIGNTIYLGGNFTAVRSKASGGEVVGRRYLAAFDANTGTLVRSWAPSAGARVYAMVTDGSTLYVGGAFRAINGQSRERLAALDPATGALRAWSPKVTGEVRALLLHSGKIYAGGGFSQANGASRTRLAAFSASSGGLDPDWKPQAHDGDVRALAVRGDGTRIFVGGSFSRINGTSDTSFIAAVNTTNGASVSWNASSAAIVHDLDVSAGRVYAARGGAGGRVTSYRDDTGASVWSHSANGDIQAVHYDNGNLYVGGHFELQGTCNTCRPVAFAAHDLNTMLGKVAASDGRLDTNFHPLFKGIPGVWTILRTGSQLHVGGSFTTAGGRQQQGYARFTDR
jgi:hypothetical protein